jgi:hypothetical protein
MRRWSKSRSRRRASLGLIVSVTQGWPCIYPALTYAYFTHEVLQPLTEPGVMLDFIGQPGPSFSKPMDVPKELPKVQSSRFLGQPQTDYTQEDKKKKQDTDISKIREKHAKEQMSERWAAFPPSLPSPRLTEAQASVDEPRLRKWRPPFANSTENVVPQRAARMTRTNVKRRKPRAKAHHTWKPKWQNTPRARWNETKTERRRGGTKVTSSLR